jgi:hypothetical protein
LTPGSLLDRARSITGLTDFGPGEFEDGLAVLCESLASEAGLTELGEKAVRATVRGALVARLVSRAGLAAHPDRPAVTRPIVVTGLPRTGTTFLHRLLVADPAHQGLELFLAHAPQPRPPRSQWSSDPVYQMVAAGLAKQGGMPGVHEIAPGQVEECWWLLQQSLRSVSFPCLLHVPSYTSWLATQDWEPPYRLHRENLSLIGLNDGDRRWVLKNPSHLFALDALLAVYPDACVVVTHRDPVAAMASTCNLSARAASGWSTVFTGPVIGRTQLALWSRGLSVFTQARARHDPAQFCDVAYPDLVADPVGVVERIYKRFGLPFSPAAARAVAAVAASSAAGDRRHSLAPYALTETEVLDKLGSEAKAVDESSTASTGQATRARASRSRRR